MTATPTKNEISSARWSTRASNSALLLSRSAMTGTPMPTTISVSAIAKTASVKKATRSKLSPVPSRWYRRFSTRRS